MRKFTFIPTGLIILGYLIIFYSFYHWSGVITFLCLWGLLIICFVFRRSSIPYRDTIKSDGEIYLAPVHGVVESIRKDIKIEESDKSYHEIRISLSLWKEKGLYLPTAGEVSFLKYQKGGKVPINSNSKAFSGSVSDIAHTDLFFISKNQTQTLLRFIDCPYGQRPTIWLKSGDRGRGAACFGHYPFGGTLLIYIPENSDILVFEREQLVPGQSVLAAIKDQR